MNVQYVEEFRENLSYKIQICRLIKWCRPPASILLRCGRSSAVLRSCVYSVARIRESRSLSGLLWPLNDPDTSAYISPLSSFPITSCRYTAAAVPRWSHNVSTWDCASPYRKSRNGAEINRQERRILLYCRTVLWYLHEKTGTNNNICNCNRGWKHFIQDSTGITYQDTTALPWRISSYLTDS
jgi:hypothetical protein